MLIVVDMKPSVMESNRLNYVIDFFNKHPLCPENIKLVTLEQYGLGEAEKVIRYGVADSGEYDYFIPSHTNQIWNNDPRHLVTNEYYNKTGLIYSVYNSKTQGGQFFSEGKYGFDIFSTVFYHITRYEEVFAHKEDNHDRGWLDEEKHLLVREGVEKRPVVDELVAAFFEVITNTRISTPTTYSISHDVDIIFRFKPMYRFFRSLAATVYYLRGWDQLYRCIIHGINQWTTKVSDPYDSFQYLFREEAEFIKRLAFFMTGGNSKVDNNYSIDDPYITTLASNLVGKEYTIGLHPSYNTPFTEGMFSDEKTRLEKRMGIKVIHSRQHLLRWNWECTPRYLETNNIENDYSLGFNKRLGFRCGTGFSYRLYNFKEERPFRWKEHPLTCMESAALHESKRKSSSFINEIISFIEANRLNTLLFFNFHNNSFDPTTKEGRDLNKFYNEQLIELISSQS